MSLRLAIGLCVVVIGTFSISLCQPPSPRIAQGEGPAHEVVVPSDVTAQSILVAFDSTGQAIQIRNLDGLLTNFSKRSR